MNVSTSKFFVLLTLSHSISPETCALGDTDGAVGIGEAEKDAVVDVRTVDEAILTLVGVTGIDVEVDNDIVTGVGIDTDTGTFPNDCTVAGTSVFPDVVIDIVVPDANVVNGSGIVSDAATGTGIVVVTTIVSTGVVILLGTLIESGAAVTEVILFT